MKTSCGIMVIWNKKVLLAHPTNKKWMGSYTVPKGGIEEGEDEKSCASREFKEEVGIDIDRSLLNDFLIIDYKTKKDKVYKKLYIYIHRIDDLSQIGLNTAVVPKEQLQLEEVDWCGFLDKEEALIRLIDKQSSLLDVL